MVKVDAVFSREGDPRRSYVQHAIVERADDVWDLIENRRATIYVCGPWCSHEVWCLDGRQ